MNLNIEQLIYLDKLAANQDGGVLGCVARFSLREDSVSGYESCKRYTDKLDAIILKTLIQAATVKTLNKNL